MVMEKSGGISHGMRVWNNCRDGKIVYDERKRGSKIERIHIWITIDVCEVVDRFHSSTNTRTWIGNSVERQPISCRSFCMTNPNLQCITSPPP